MGKATPLLFISMCAFIANDLDDQETDRVNHPNRPLAAGLLNPSIAAVLYFICLGAALFSIRYQVESRIAFWYYALVIACISYSYIVEWVPILKAPYVAAASSVPILIVAASFPAEPRLRAVAMATSLFVLGREVCMDITDRTGDVASLLHNVSPIPLAIAAFLLQTAGVLLLRTYIRTVLDAADIIAIACVLLLSGIAWFNFRRERIAIALMKLPLLLGLYLLV